MKSAQDVLALFREIAAVPRPSHHGERIVAWLNGWAHGHGFAPKTDAAGNVWFDVPATKGMEDKPLLMLQAHSDMVVAIRPGEKHCPAEDPIELAVDGEWLVSRNNRTSLGADDGIGIAIAFCIADGGMPHGPLRVLVTSDEEDGMCGVESLAADVLGGVRYLINLDSEEEGSVIISSAAGVNVDFEGEGASCVPRNGAAFHVALTGCTGGHSGEDIQKCRLNAIVALADVLRQLRAAGIDFQLASMDGGTKRNSIPEFAEAVVVFPAAREAVARQALAKGQELLRSHAHPETAEKTDPGVMLSMEGISLPDAVFEDSRAVSLLDFLVTVPNGVRNMSSAVPGLVETSTNPGVFHAGTDGILMENYARGSNKACLEALVDEMTSCAPSFLNAAVKQNGAAWPAEPNSPLLMLFKDAYRTLFDTDLKVKAIHAGLECGLFKSLNPNVQIISMGPTVVSPHSVKERCHIPSIDNVWKLLETVLAEI